MSKGFPWVTLVLGSGCLEVEGSTSLRAVANLPSDVAGSLVDHPRLLDDTDPADLAKAFVQSILNDRFSVPLTSTHPARASNDEVDSPHRPPVDLTTAHLALLAALLTRFYHQVKTISTDAPCRWDDDRAVLPELTQSGGELRSLLIEPISRLLDNTIDVIGRRETRVDEALVDLLNEIREQIRPPAGRPPVVRYTDLQVLTECVWYLLTQSTELYPGWSDLLVGLSMSGRRLLPATHGRPRPAFDSLQFGPQLIRETYGYQGGALSGGAHPSDITSRSWSNRRDEGVSERSAFYDGAAHVLAAQATLRSRIGTASKPPVASAFVTTFDLELEMALLARSPSDPFLVAIPVYLFRTEEDEVNQMASLCWLACQVTPDLSLDHEERLDQLRHPSKWFVLSNYTDFDTSPYANMPIVVRLSGCPLIDLPGPGDPAANIDGIGRLGLRVPEAHTAELPGKVSVSMVHAVLLDEYAAMQQTAAENFREDDPQTKHKKWYGMPAAITGVEGMHTHARFWMVMGVQMSDSGVRYRLASHIASPALISTPPDPSQVPLRAGVVVNRRLDASDQDLMYWYGFDVVRVACQDFAPDLRHYVKHLESPQLRSRKDKACPIL